MMENNFVNKLNKKKRESLMNEKPSTTNNYQSPKCDGKRSIKHQVDVCVVGGGMAGLCAAVAAARNGASVVLMQDRPVLGGNGSSEIRVGLLGAFGHWDFSRRETGVIEEVDLESLYLNPGRNWEVWAAVLHGFVKSQPGLELLLNCSCLDGEMSNGHLHSIRGWELTSYTWHEVSAKQFIDCSGDSILGDIAGAEMCSGREGRSEFNEPHAPEASEPHTMPTSLIRHFRDVGQPAPFQPMPWAYHYGPKPEDGPPRRVKPGSLGEYVEYGGLIDTLADAEHIRDELVKTLFGAIAKYKAHPDAQATNLDLDWVGMVPGKRESRRYIADYTLTENDIIENRRFDDIVAYGGWKVDDHDSNGSMHHTSSHTFHFTPVPYGIPLCSLYSRNVENLFCAGRNIGVSHLALCSTRVMRTCAVVGQAVGTAATLGIRYACSPRQVGQKHIKELQEQLMADDCWLPGLTRTIPQLTREASQSASCGDPEPLRDGCDRPDEAARNEHAWFAGPGEWVELRFDQSRRLAHCRIVFDSDLRRKPLSVGGREFPDDNTNTPPATLVKAFRLLAQTADGTWTEAARLTDNHQRLVRIPLTVETDAVRLVIDETWGEERTRVFGFEVT